MLTSHSFYDSGTDQLVILVPATEGDGHVELLRIDVAALTDQDRQRLRHVRPPDQPQPDPVGEAIATALTRLQELIDAPAIPEVPPVPAGTFTTAQLSDYLRAVRNVIAEQRDANQATRAGAQEVAETLRQTIRLVRGDFGEIDAG